MSWNEAGSGASGLFAGGFGWGGVLLVIGMVIALAIVSGLGILARLRDRATEQRATAALSPLPAESGGVDGNHGTRGDTSATA